MYILIKYILFLFVLTYIQLIAQVNINNRKTTKETNSKVPNSTNAANNTIEFKNTDGTPIITITDEGARNGGSITLPPISSSTIFSNLNKLYNQDGILKFNGAVVGADGGADSINQLADAKYDGSSLFIGEGAGANDDVTDNENTAIGFQALNSNTSGYYNTALGHRALYLNTTGRQNIAVGHLSLVNNLSGVENIGIGWNSLYSNTAGHGNVAVGYQSLTYNTIGIGNTGLGYSANYFNQVGSQNTIIGYEAGKGTTAHNKTGNVFLGFRAGYHETSDNKLYINNDSSSNPLIWGNFSDGSEEVKINGDLHVSGSITTDSPGFGATEINDLTDAEYDGYSLFLGVGAGSNDNGTNYNTALGIQALNLNLGGEYNTAIGLQALLKNTSGNSNTAIGYQALNSNTIGKYNIGLGTSTNYYNQEGSNNTIIGYEAGVGSSLHNKSGNIFIGYQAGYNETTDNKLYIENSNSLTPLIYGDFDTDSIQINGKLEVTEKTQIGEKGVPITEIKLLSGSLSTSLFVTEIPYPTGYNQSNTFLVSCKVGPPSGSGTIWDNVGKYGSGDDRSLSVSFSETQILLYRTDSNSSARDYKMVIMKIE